MNGTIHSGAPVPDSPAENWQPWLAPHESALFLMARQYLATPQEAEDAMQEGFIKFWQSRHAAHDPVAYLFTCVRNAAIDLRRSAHSRQRYQQNVLTPTPPLFITTLEQTERRQQIELALAKLPEPQREVLILKIWADLTFAQIGETLQIPPETAATRHRAALHHLETLLPKEFKNV